MADCSERTRAEKRRAISNIAGLEAAIQDIVLPGVKNGIERVTLEYAGMDKYGRPMYMVGVDIHGLDGTRIIGTLVDD